MARPHIRLNINRQRDPSVSLRFNYGFDNQDEEPEDNPDPVYDEMAREFRRLAIRLGNDRQTRRAERNPQLQVPANIEYIRIQFQSQFVISEFYASWRADFGLLGVHISNFGHEILFAIEDQALFESFLLQIDHFIKKELAEDPALTYESRITYIKSFRLLTSAEVIRSIGTAQIFNLQLVDDSLLPDPIYTGVQTALIDYVLSRGIRYRLTNRSHHLELEGASEAQLAEIVQNFDIVLLVTAALATIVAPSPLGQPERTYGFTVAAGENDLPIAAIVDTGISDQTPLAPVIVRDARYNLTQSSPFSDSVDHGTALGALAALGRKAYTGGYRGAFSADARLLPVKIMDGARGFVSQVEIIGLLYQVKQDYPGIKIFVLATCFQTPKNTNEDFSTYAAELDAFGHRTDSLVFICTSNNNDASNVNRSYDQAYFHQETTNLCPPAESMNSITVGAAAGSMRPGGFVGISPSQEFPTLYSRRGHCDLNLLYSSRKINKNYFKPDILEYGGDLEYGPGRAYIAAGIRASMQVLSADRTQSFYEHVGTSFAAGLSANPALRIQRAYPSLRAQTIKALLINSASLDRVQLEEANKSLLNRVAGHGLLNPAGSLLSSDNGITFVLEDEIGPETVNIYPIHFPTYLTALPKKRGMLRISATLCFSFDPLLMHQLAYCPVHMGFAFFRNHHGDDILAKESDVRSSIGAGRGWSQSARFTSKPAPYTNVQKKFFTISRDLLTDEDHTLKLAVNCRVNPQLVPGIEAGYRGPFAFSMAVSFEENLKANELTGRLYDEMIAINEVIGIASADVEAIAEAEG